MKKKSVLISAIMSLAVLVAGVATWSLMYAGRTSAADAQELEVQMTAKADSLRIFYSITLVNNTSSNYQSLYVAGNLPEGARFDSVTATPAGSSSLGLKDGNVAWVVPEVKAMSKVGPFTYKIATSLKEVGQAHAWVRWDKPSPGSVSSADVPMAQVVVDKPRRGCESCHVVGGVPISKEAKDRARNHPQIAEDTKVTTCLQCHAPGTGEREGKGVVAPLALRDIVHPVHLNSPGFLDTYKGNCFTCHNVDGKGNFVLLGDKLDTDFRGIPNAPVKGIPPSETTRR
ncbi:MAG: hypothetical protein HYU86_00560 [Chloroflexi bacterium]|nr:hypothetical protein [Chloroflexota bacterium]